MSCRLWNMHLGSSYVLHDQPRALCIPSTSVIERAFDVRHDVMHIWALRFQDSVLTSVLFCVESTSSTTARSRISSFWFRLINWLGSFRHHLDFVEGVEWIHYEGSMTPCFLNFLVLPPPSVLRRWSSKPKSTLRTYPAAYNLWLWSLDGNDVASRYLSENWTALLFYSPSLQHVSLG